MPMSKTIRDDGQSNAGLEHIRYQYKFALWQVHAYVELFNLMQKLLYRILVYYIFSDI